MADVLREGVYHPSDLVIALDDIPDCPASREDSSAHRGDHGVIDDYDDCAGLFFVDFGRGSIACSPDEIAPR